MGRQVVASQPTTRRTKTKIKKIPRPSIPEQTQRELWGHSAGRCAFRGCNKLLHRDDLTQKRSNLAIVSHIVSYSPNHARGHTTRSKELEKDIRNLMLTCQVHGKLIDDEARVPEYPESLLLEFKHEHENRVRMLTDVKDSAQAHVLLLQISIDAQDFSIDETSAFRAILPNYPAEESARIIDLTGLGINTTLPGFFNIGAASVTAKVKENLRRVPGGKRVKALAVFALAPIPLLVHFGYEIGDIHNVELFQYHRDTQDWTWKPEPTNLTEEDELAFFQVLEPEDADDGDRPISLVLSVSGPVDRETVKTLLGENVLIHEIHARNLGVDALRTRSQLNAFGQEARRLLADIRGLYSQDRVIHVIGAVPAPIAIEFGRSIHQYDSPFLVYEFDKTARTYFPAVEINNHVH